MDECECHNGIHYYGGAEAKSNAKHKARRKRKWRGPLSKCLIVSLIWLLFPIVYILLSITLSGGLSTVNHCIWPQFAQKQNRRCHWFSENQHTVVLISMSGFRHDYLKLVRSRLGRNALPNFRRMEREGVRANRSINVWPTLTLPNHQTLLTGLYPNWHGIVANVIQTGAAGAKRLDSSKQISLNNDDWLTNWPEPIWVTLQRQGGLAGSILWPLTDGAVKNELPFQQVSGYALLNSPSGHYSFEKRITDSLHWLTNPRYKLDLLLLYFNEPDLTGKAFGPRSIWISRAVEDLDIHLGRLLDGIENNNSSHNVDIIVTSDHGMSETRPTGVIELDSYIHPSWYSYTHLSSIGFIYPNEGQFQLVYSRLRHAHPHLRVYRLEEMPAELHFNRSHSRTPPLVLVPDPHWQLARNAANNRPPAGSHGYSSSFPDMHPFFIAKGPSFRTGGHLVDAVHAVDIYPLLCALLHIRPEAHNGSLARISGLLKPQVAARLRQGSGWLWPWIAANIRAVWLLCFVLITMATATALLANEVLRRKSERAYEKVEDISHL